MIDARVAYHPAAAFTDGWASWFGLDVRAQIALGIRTVDSDGNEFKSSYSTYHAACSAASRSASTSCAVRGLRRPEVHARVEDGGHQLAHAQHRLPHAAHRWGGDFQFTDSLAMGLDAAWLQFLTSARSASGSRARRAPVSRSGTDIVYAVTPMFFARAFGAYQRVFFDFKLEDGDENRRRRCHRQLRDRRPRRRHSSLIFSPRVASLKERADMKRS